MELYLIRHGECYATQNQYYDDRRKTMNPPLTETGIRQAALLAERLKPVRFDRIYASDLDRALQTAEAIANEQGQTVISNAAFREINMGEVFLKSWSEFPETYAQWIRHLEDMPYPGGECGMDVWQRCRPELERIVTDKADRIALVCHGGTIRSIICGVLGIPQEKRFYLGMPPVNCSISILKWANGEYYLHTFNDYTHITG